MVRTRPLQNRFSPDPPPLPHRHIIPPPTQRAWKWLKSLAVLQNQLCRLWKLVPHQRGKLQRGSKSSESGSKSSESGSKSSESGTGFSSGTVRR
jgi:uncharacterized membrane protein YgcG